MFGFLRSKVGMVLAGVYVAAVVVVLIVLYFTHRMHGDDLLPTLVYMALTLPWCIWLPKIPVMLGIITFDVSSHEKYDALFFYLETIVAVLINGSVIYLFGCLVSAGVRLIASGKK